MPKDVLKNYVSEDGTYLIPVSWSVYSTIRVKADNLEMAVKLAKAHMDEIPLCSDSEYIDGSYKIDVEDNDDALNAQHYHDMSDGKIFEWKD